MSICSRHMKNPQPDCAACNCVPERDIPGFKEKLAEAEAAGEYKCLCGFVYYRTILFCPRCGLTTKTSTFHKVMVGLMFLLLATIVSCATMYFIIGKYSDAFLLTMGALMIAHHGDRDFDH